MPSNNNSVAIVKNIIKSAALEGNNVMRYIKARAINMHIDEDTVDCIINDLYMHNQLVEFKDSNGVNLYFLKSKKYGPFEVHHTEQTGYDQEITPLVQVETDYLEYTVYETDQDTAVELWQRDCWDYQDKMSF